MSEMSKKARAANRAKAERLGNGSIQGKLDSSDFTPSEPLNTTAKTGARPVRSRIYKAGGKVQGDRGPRRADKSSRLGKEIADAKINRSVPAANAEEFGSPHVGAFKKGGKAKRTGRDMGGLTDPRETAKGALAAAGDRSGTPQARMGSTPVQSGFGKMIGIKRGGRTKRADGGRTKGKTNINIIIGSQKPADGMTPPGQGPVRPPIPVPVPPMGGAGAPPAGVPMPMPAGGPPGGPPGMMGRKEGGRVKHTASSTEALTAGAGGGLGRLQKEDLQEHSRR